MSSAPAEPKVWTAEELERLPGNGRRIEIVRGKLLEEPPSDLLRSLTVARLIPPFESYVGTYWVLCGAGFKVRTEPDTVLAPALSLVSKPRIPRIHGVSNPSLTPDLVIEVVASNDSASDFFCKLRIYLESGCSAVWVLAPQFELAEIHKPNGAVIRLGPDGALEDSDLLPGFRLPLSEVFEQD